MSRMDPVVKEVLKKHPKIAALAASFVGLTVVAFGLDIPGDRVAAMSGLMGLLAIGVWYSARWAMEPFRRRNRGE